MASTRLSDTMGTPTLGTKFTYSCWVKRSALGSAQTIASMWSDSSTHIVLRFDLQDNLSFYATQSSTFPLELETNAAFRDTSAWYHIVAKVDTTQATSSDRCKLYVNGEEQTSLSTSTYPSQDATFTANASGTTHYVGGRGDGSYWDGLITHAHFTDGYAYDASDFGQTDSTTGIWKPITSPSVTYGTNGFFLKFQDSSNFGDDSSGNTNDFTTSGTITQNVDTPSNNFITMDPLQNRVSSSGVAYPMTTFSNGNTKLESNNSSAYTPAVGNIGLSSGKWYFECKMGTLGYTAFADTPSIGIKSLDAGLYDAQYDDTIRAYVRNGNKVLDSTTSSFGNTYTTGDIIGVALYTSISSYSTSSTVYLAGTGNGEVSSSGTNYTAGGNTLTNNGVSVSSNIAFIDFADLTFSSVTLTAAGAAIYKTTGGGNELVMVLDFGGDKTATNGDFVVQFPTNDSSNAILRIGNA